MPRFFLILLLCLLAAVRNVPAAADAASNFILYSDICVHAETGDLLGTRIGLIKLSDATYAFFQVAEGVTESPQINKLSSGDIKDGKIAFPVLIAGKSKIFQGTITNTAITGNFSDHSFGPSGKTVFHLNKVAMPERPSQQCR